MTDITPSWYDGRVLEHLRSTRWERSLPKKPFSLFEEQVKMGFDSISRKLQEKEETRIFMRQDFLDKFLLCDTPIP